MSLSSTSPITRTAALALTGLLATTGCSAAGGSDGSAGGDQLSLVGFSVLEAANVPVFEEFEGTGEGEGVTFKTSYGASGDQSRAVEGGLDADVVHFSLEPDMQRLVDAGLVAEDWKDNETKGIVTSSVVTFVVREGNPEDIQSWDDLVKPGVEIITPNPASSGSAKWNILGRLGPRRRCRRHRRRGRGVRDHVPREHHRAARLRRARRPPRSPRATATC